MTTNVREGPGIGPARSSLSFASTMTSSRPLTISPPPDRVTERLCRLVLLGILPAVVERDLLAFGAALDELQARIGAAFAAVRGSVYASARSEGIIAELGRLGLSGGGQSSWGPTLYAFGFLSEHERDLMASRLHERCGLHPAAITWTKAANQGAVTTLRYSS